MRIPPERIVMMEDHDRAYRVWKERGVSGKVLIHVDAHIDFGWIPEADMDEIGPAAVSAGVLVNPYVKPRDRMVTIGNYICPAIREGMVKKFYWVVPGESLRSARGRAYIIRQLRRLLKLRRYGVSRLEAGPQGMHCVIMGCELVVCSLETVGVIDEPALLDIDTDFLVTPRIWHDLEPRRLPWIQPDELIRRLDAVVRDVELCTIAYSVEGGYTPLRFKYLGDEMRLLCAGSLPPAMRARREALARSVEGKPREAVALYEEALKIDPGDASAYYNLCLLYMELMPAAPGKAAEYLAHAIARDKSYDTRYNNYGILYLRNNRPDRAEKEYLRFLEVDKGNPSCLNGLGHIALERGRFRQAEEYFDSCLSVDPRFPEARAGKGIVCFRGARLEEARQLFSALQAERPGDPEVSWWLGRIAEASGDATAATGHYKDAVMQGGEGVMVHLRMARLYARRSAYFRAWEELKRAARQLRVML